MQRTEACEGIFRRVTQISKRRKTPLHPPEEPLNKELFRGFDKTACHQIRTVQSRCQTFGGGSSSATSRLSIRVWSFLCAFNEPEDAIRGHNEAIPIQNRPS